MVPRRDKPKPLRMRPLAALLVAVSCIATSIARGGGWRTAGYVLAVVTVAGILGWRLFQRRLERARQPDPESTLHL